MVRNRFIPPSLLHLQVGTSFRDETPVDSENQRLITRIVLRNSVEDTTSTTGSSDR